MQQRRHKDNAHVEISSSDAEQQAQGQGITALKQVNSPAGQEPSWRTTLTGNHAGTRVGDPCSQQRLCQTLGRASWRSLQQQLVALGVGPSLGLLAVKMRRRTE